MNGKYLVVGAFTAVLILGAFAVLNPAINQADSLTDKRQSYVDSRLTEQKSIEISQSATDVARSGAGARRKIDIELNESKVRLDEEGNFLELEVPAREAPYSSDWSLIRGSSLQGTSIGKGDYVAGGYASIVAAKYISEEETLKYRIEFRNVRVQTPSGPVLQYVDLVGSLEKNVDTLYFVKNRTREEKYRTSNGEVTRRITELEVSGQ